MSARQVAVQGRRLGAPIVVALVISAFAVGLVTGVGLLRSVGSGSQITLAVAPAVQPPLGYGPWSTYVDSTYAAGRSRAVQPPLGYGPWSTYVESTYAAGRSRAAK